MTAAELLSVAAFDDGRFAQAFPCGTPIGAGAASPAQALRGAAASRFGIRHFMGERFLLVPCHAPESVERKEVEP